MSRKLGIGITEDGFARIAEAAARQRKREASLEQALQPAELHYGSVEEVARDFYQRDDGKVADRQAHRVWEMKARPGGGFDLIRAQDETVAEPPGADEPVEPGADPMTARLAKAASRGARYHAQMAPTIPPTDEVPVEAQGVPAEMPPVTPTAQADACSCGGACQCDCGCGEAGACVCQAGCPCACGCGAATAQAVPAPAAPPAAPAPMTAGLRDVAETREDRRLAGVKRGVDVLVRIGKRDVMKGRVLARSATHFDVLLANGATTRVAHRDIAPIATPAGSPRAPQTQTRQAVDDKARDYWEAYFKEYGRQLVKSDLPRAVTDRAEPATPAGKQKTPTKSAAKATVGDVVDIGNIWMAGQTLRIGTVKIVKAGTERVAVQDPFGGKMLVPRAAIMAVLDKHAFAAARRGAHDHRVRAGLIQMASAALSWDQIDARYPKAADKIRQARRWISAGVKIALADGAVPIRGPAGRDGRVAAEAAWNPKLRKRAIDELGKSYYRAYWGDYGDDLVKEVRRRVKADVLDRKLGRVRSARPAASPAKPAPAPVAPRPKSLRASLADALTAHVGGIMKREGAVGRYSVDPATIEVTASTREQNRRTITGRFVGRYTGPERQSVARKSFELLVENGSVKAVKITG